jgi:CHAT domain-containing protein
MLPRKKQVILAACVLASFCVTAQDWKTKYDQAIKQYQEGQYGPALANAKDAYKAAEALDQKNQAYSLQLITVICLDAGNADEGLLWIGKEVALFAKIDGAKSKTYAEALSKHARLFVQKGQYPAAEVRCKDALTAFADAGLQQGADHEDMNFLYGQMLALNKKPEALAVVDQSVTAFSGNPERGEEYIDALLLSASLSVQRNDLPSAEKKYRQLVVLLEKNNLKDLPAYAQAQTALSKIATTSGNTAAATEILKGGSVDPTERARQLLKIAVDHQNAHQYSLAAENFDLAEQAITEGNLKNNTAFSVYLNHGRLLTEQKKLEKASTSLNRASILAGELYRAPSAEIALLNFSKGDLEFARDQTKEAGIRYTEALNNTSALALNLRVQYLNNAARKMLSRDQATVAIALLKADCATLNEKSLNDALLIDAINTYTLALAENNQQGEAITVLKELSAKPFSAPVKQQLRVQQALVLKEAGQWSAAVAVLNEANRDTSMEPALRLNLDYLLGDLYLQLGNFSDSEKHLLSCVDAIKKGVPSGNLQLDVYNSLAMLYTRLGNYERAEAMYMDLLKQADPAPGFHTSIQQNLASLYFEAARYTEAQLLLEDVLRQDLERYGENHPDYATSMQNLAAVYLKNKELDKARDMYEKALALDAKLSGTQSLTYATKAANLGVVYQETGDFNKAVQYLESALLTREKKLGKDHPDYVFNEYNLANALEELGQSQKAALMFRHIGAFYIKQIHELFPAMSEREKTAFYNKISEVITSYLDFTIKHAATEKTLTGELYDFRLATKALLLNSSSKIRNRILSSQNPQLMEAFSGWLTAKDELGKLYSLSYDERIANQELIKGLQQKANELERQLSQQSELFAESTEREVVDWKKVKQSLSAGDAAIEIIRLGLDANKDSVRYAALVLRPENELPQLIVFPNSRKMETKEFSYYRNTIQYQLLNERSYGFYWKPLEPSLKGVKRIFLSADGVFNKVNMATLYDPATKQYVIEQYSIGLVTNTRELIVSGHVRLSSTSAALFGSPDFGKTTTAPGGTRGMSNLAKGILGTGISELPGTLAEVSQIDAYLKASSWQTTVHVGNSASEQAIKSQNNPGVLHIATHGFFVETEDDKQAVVGGGDMSQSEHNPLLRSGLVLAGAGKYLVEKTPAGDDGVLTAYEAINLTLEKTDLVVLSACETGSGEVRNGEGVYGLQRAFLLAGASNLLMSLWKVDDQATLELMLQLYKDMQSVKEKSQAFRNTQLEIKKIHPHPYYWGSFVLIGHHN